MKHIIHYRDTSISRSIVKAHPDEYRGDVCMELRETFDRPDLADEVGGWSNERIHNQFQGVRPYSAARTIVETEMK